MAPAKATLTAAEARRVAIVAQGLRDPRHDPPTLRTFDRTLGRTGVLQIDSVNVLQRAHYMPLFSRMGPYDPGLLERASARAPRRVVEYWAHVAAFMPVDLWPVMRWRMRGYRDRGHAWTGLPEKRSLVESLMAEIREGGAATARDLDDGLPRTKDNWGWNWSESKRALEYLFVAGELAVAGRNPAFERLYDLPERVLPRRWLDAPVPEPLDAVMELLRRAAVSHGVGTMNCLRDYYRCNHDPAQSKLVKPALAALVEAGELLPVTIAGWDRPAFLHRDVVLPRVVRARALLSPFDPLVWERERTEKLFGFHYRIEIYVPEAKRIHGYYVLPFLLGDRIVARVDLKADRAAGVLRVQGAYAEPDAPDDTAPELAEELRSLAGWLGLTDIAVGGRGDLAAALSTAL